MRRCLLILLLLVSACGGDEEPPLEPPPLEDPDVPTPPPEYANPTLDVSSGQEPLPEGVEVATPPAEKPEATPAADPHPETDEPHPAIELGTLTVVEAVAASDIVDRRPQGDPPFADGSEVNIFTRIENPGGHQRTIRHQWHYDGSRRSNVALKVKGTTWRTWSTRPVYGVGEWRVDVVDEAGTVLESVTFTVK